MFFDWFYPQFFPILVKTIATWSDTHNVVYPVLRFVSEFVFNVHSRIEFEPHSPNGNISRHFFKFFYRDFAV
jgi:exportin-7